MGKDTKINELVDKVQAYYPTADVGLIRTAYDFSAKVHQGQKRLSGEPYLIHPLAVAGIIAEALSAVFDDTSVSEIFDGENLA